MCCSSIPNISCVDSAAMVACLSNHECDSYRWTYSHQWSEFLLAVVYRGLSLQVYSRNDLVKSYGPRNTDCHLMRVTRSRKAFEVLTENIPRGYTTLSIYRAPGPPGGEDPSKNNLMRDVMVVELVLYSSIGLRRRNPCPTR